MDVRYALNPVGSLVGRHLLVVEDDKDARDVFCAMLDYEGAMVLGTASAEEALGICLLYTSPSPRDRQKSRMPSSA